MRYLSNVIGYTTQDNIAIVEIQRPEKRNALTAEIISDIKQALRTAADEKARVIVLTGQGSVFCAGADLDTALFDKNFLLGQLDLIRYMQQLPIPIIAAVNGPALGAGLQLAMAADLRILDPSATIAIPAAKIAVAVDSWTIKRLAHLVGWGHARSITFGCFDFNAQRLLETGFANAIGDRKKALDYATSLSLLAPLTLQHYKLVLNDDGALDEPKPEQTKALLRAWESDDLKRGMEARKTRKLPNYEGR